MKQRDLPGLTPAQQLRAEAEAHVALGPLPQDSTLDPAVVLHELRAHQIELEMQNDELRRAQAELEAARDRYLELYDFAPVGYLTLDAQGLVAECNLTGARMLRAERARLKGRPFSGYVAPADGDRWHHHLRALLRGESGRIELALLTQGGDSCYAQIDAVCLVHPGQRPMFHVTLADITARRHSETELRLAAAAFESQEGMVITDAQGVIQRVNSAFCEQTGYTSAEAVGKTSRLLQSGRHTPAFYAAMWQTLRRTGSWHGELWNRRKSGEVYPLLLTITAVHETDPDVTRYVGTMLDISLRKSQEEEVAQLAFYDPLTGLPNRRLMKDRLQQAQAVSARARRDGALMFVDLDDFKEINDTLGHDKGDELLRQVAQRLTACVRECDTVARPSGDEFVVVLASDLSDNPQAAAEHAKVVGEKILAALRQPYVIEGQDVPGSASIGIAMFADHLQSVDELLKRADHAMYQAKAAGRNTLRFYDAGIQQLLLARTTLDADLRHALQREEFVLHYQPVVGRDRRLVGAEALVRWQHPERGLVMPADFIGVAEERGHIVAMGRWVLGAACAQLARWAGQPGGAELSLSVNVSARQWRDQRYVELVLETLQRHGIDPKRLTLELTEGLLLDDVEATIARMQALKAKGVRMALDDFGTGYASLSYLKRLPLDELKIDRSFVHDVLNDSRDAAIVRAIVAVGRGLGLRLVAEGVETEAQRDLFLELGCDGFQGSLFGSPGPVDSLARHGAAA